MSSLLQGKYGQGTEKGPFTTADCTPFCIEGNASSGEKVVFPYISNYVRVKENKHLLPRRDSKHGGNTENEHPILKSQGLKYGCDFCQAV